MSKQNMDHVCIGSETGKILRSSDLILSFCKERDTSFFVLQAYESRPQFYHPQTDF